ncbi:hypothetical protein TRIATDRAFT_217787 [Trichoderma atroviride IMI 206040]|uniref:NACHT domain-containing protein n=1 Tax=Hypocrea atroviridis (strain ATCC 20476 / IMI 206040) TaxID=452589 RepID=G9NQ96_HYPAI|nr:uncharacterized protein TRIATDRAFT_217787 [Trichoderma atroviride IMI 206040]EHK47241.1 hypothetical protein TRIATDRAFT_217787 [Trichoderma atroviride IMI 206040]
MSGKENPRRLSRLKKLFKRNTSSSPSSSRQRISHVHSSGPPTSSTAAVEAEAEPAEQQHASLSKSQELWNAAYDSLAQSEDTAKLVRSYIKTLTTVLMTKLSDIEVSANINDRTKRQDLMRELVESGQAKVSKTSTGTNGVSGTAQFIVSAKGLVDAAVRNIPQAALPWAGVSIGLQILMNPANATRSNLDGIAHVVSRMRWYCALTEHFLEKDHVDGLQSIWLHLEEKILFLYKVILLYQMKSVCSYYRHRGYEFLQDLANWNHWDDDIKTIRAAEDSLRNDLEQYINVQGKDMLGRLFRHATKMNDELGSFHQTLQDFLIFQKSNVDEKNKQCLRDLFVVDPQDDMKKIEKNKDALLSEANEWIFQTEEYQAFTDWSSVGSTSPSCRLLWIKGDAGTGKTMLLMGIIRELLSHSATLAPKVSHFFCQGTVKSLNTATATLRCLLWLLLVQQPHLMSHLKAKHDNAGASLFEGDGAFISLNDVFENILKDPKLSPVYLVVDALDECEQGLDDLKKLMFTSLKISNKVKWLVSSRPTVDLNSPEMEGSLVELDSQKLQNPVNAFIDHKLSVLKARPGYTDEILGQLKKEIIRRAENTFLWVALVFKELDKEDGFQIVVDGMYALDIVGETPSGLSQLYDYIMNKIEKGLRQDCKFCKNVLVAATLAFRPLALSELRVLAQLPDNVPATIIRKCGSFLVVQDETAYLIHQSAKDYLQENYESRLRPTGMSQGHEDLAMCSIQAMSSDLRQNMYNLDYGLKPENIRPPDPDPLASIRYSCVFWADHLYVVDLKSLEHTGVFADDGALSAFLREKFLNWLEGLSLLGNLAEGVESVRKLLHIARAYASALAFTPTASEVRAVQWKHRLPFIKKLEGVKPHWDAHRQTLEAGSRVNSVAFSPNGKILASGLWDNVVRLWEVSTGSHIRTLEGHRGVVFPVVFSPDGRILASASQDTTIRLWQVPMGSSKWTLKGHSASVGSVAFSPDGKILASSSDDKTIRLWDVALGSCLQIIEEHNNRVRSVTFSPDGQILASASDYEPIRLWDMANGKHRRTLEAHGGQVSCLHVAFSPDGSVLAASLDNSTIQLWDTSSWSQRQTLGVNLFYFPSLAFSPDGKMLALQGLDGTIQLWDIATGSIWDTIAGHIRGINSIVFSPDSMTLASASNDETIRLWDVDSRNRRSTIKEHSDWDRQVVTSMAFSPDGETLAFTSNDNLQVWDTATWSCQQLIPQMVADYKPRMIFSPDGKTLAVTQPDNLQLWDTDTSTWTCRLTQKGAVLASYETPIIVFSPDGKTLATSSQEKTIQLWLWDSTSGNTLWTLCSHKIDFVAFSPDGKTLASAWRKGIELWDMATGSHQQSLSIDGEENGSYLRLAFSPDGKTLASASYKGIELWDTTTWTYRQRLVEDSHHSFDLAFLFDGAYILTDYRPFRLLSTPASENSSETYLHFDKGWICLNGKQILWLPADYRPYSMKATSVHGNKIAWTNQTRGLNFLQVT